MGMPAIGDDEDEDEGGDKTRSTLFGVPAAGGGDPEGLEEETAPPSVDQESLSQMDASTRVASDIDLDQVLDDGAPDHEQADKTPQGADESDRVADAWGLESKDDVSDDATRVADSSIAESFAGEQYDELQEPPSSESPQSGKTLMGVAHDELDDEESTGGATPSAAIVNRDREDSLEAPTASIDADRVAELDREEPAGGGPNRRREILEKLHSKVSEVTDESESEASPPESRRQDSPPGGASTNTPPDNRPPSGPRFEIPGSGGDGRESSDEDPEDLPIEAVEPVESTSPPTTGAPDDDFEGQGLGATNFPVAETPSEAETPAGVREFADEDVREFDDDSSDSDGSIRAFTEEDDGGEPIFPIDREQDSAGRQVDLDQEASPHIDVGESQPQDVGSPAAEVGGESDADGAQSAPSGKSKPAQRPIESQLPSSPLETAQVDDRHAADRAARQRERAPETTAPEPAAPESTADDSTKKVIHLIQTILAVLAGLFLLGAGGYGVATGGLPEGEQIAVVASPVGVGVLMLVATLMPFPPRLRNGVLLTMGVLSLSALGAGLIFSAPVALLVLALSGSLLALCAGTIPMVLRLVQ